MLTDSSTSANVENARRLILVDGCEIQATLNLCHDLVKQEQAFGFLLVCIRMPFDVCLSTLGFSVPHRSAVSILVDVSVMFLGVCTERLTACSEDMVPTTVFDRVVLNARG